MAGYTILPQPFEAIRRPPVMDSRDPRGRTARSLPLQQPADAPVRPHQGRARRPASDLPRWRAAVIFTERAARVGHVSARWRRGTSTAGRDTHLGPLRHLHAQLGEPAKPPSSAVVTQGPSSVIATVCSQCAAYDPSSGDHGPAVVELPGARLAEGDHRLHRQRQARHQPRPAAGAAVVEHVRVLVHLGADAVPAVVVDDPVPVRVGPDRALDRGADVGQPAAGDGRGQPGPQRPLGDLDELQQLRGAPRRPRRSPPSRRASRPRSRRSPAR